jgi:hypothetical protein
VIRAHQYQSFAYFRDTFRNFPPVELGSRHGDPRNHSHDRLFNPFLPKSVSSLLSSSKNRLNILPFCTVWKKRDLYGPLNASPKKWHMDFTMWLYTLCLGLYAIPLTLCTIILPPPVYFFLLGPSFLLLPAVLVAILSLLQVKSPLWISSDPPGTKMRPTAVVVLEDIGAVDMRWGKDWRRAVRDRSVSFLSKKKEFFRFSFFLLSFCDMIDLILHLDFDP